MNKVSIVASVMAAAVCLPALAQESDEELQARMRDAEARLDEQERQRQVVVEQEREVNRARLEAEIADAERRMRDAEQRLAEAARDVADLSMAKLPHVKKLEQIIRTGRGPVLGITIGTPDDGGPVEGVTIQGVTPGGAADEAGLRAGDVLAAINGEMLSAASAEDANAKLLAFMSAVEEGDALQVEFLRNGKTESVEVEPRPLESAMFAFEFDSADGQMPGVHWAPRMDGFNYAWTMHGDAFGDMEMVRLTPRLGSYFGTSEGLLIVRAPDRDALKLEDGDVILSIDGRRPGSVSHALRILGSYQAGEELKIEVMRDKKKRTIEINMPENRSSALGPAVAPGVAPVAPVRVVVKSEERLR